MKWTDLTDQQQRAAGATADRIIVLGGAGSGKTTVALWCARTFLELPATKAWHRVLFLTFSRTAVREISRRFGDSWSDCRERVEIQTFHSFANRLITAFGRFVGLGTRTPTLLSEAQAKLIGRRADQVAYDDLIPMALTVIRSPLVKPLLAQRWPLVICDEFQDTDSEQWELLLELAATGRLVLLADPNQMIYTFLKNRGVGPKRLEQARALAQEVVDLGEPSHRDPTNVIPAMAQSVRRRQFQSAEVRAALDQDRLRVFTGIDRDDLVELLKEQVREALASGASTIGIFGHSNQGVADLSADLMNAGVDHVLIGLPEAHGEAFAALETLCLYGLEMTDLAAVRERLAVFVTSAVRGRDPPPIAHMLLGSTSLPLPLEERLAAISTGLLAARDEGLEELVRAATEVWPALGINPGRRPWSQASRTFAAVAHQIIIRSRGRLDQFLGELSRRVVEQRTESMLDLDISGANAIQLMNFHQTKAREADVVILVYCDDDWFGREREPFPDSSRLLYVSLSRARSRSIVVLPREPHNLVAPFAQLIVGR